jgi:PAS domain S-box-containing protein
MDFNRLNNLSADYLSLLLSNTNEGIVAFDLELNITFVNQKALDIHGLPDALTAQSWAKRVKVYETDGKTLTQKKDLPLVRALNGEDVLNSYKIIVSDNKEPLLVKYNARPLYEKGTKIGVLLTIVDSQDLAQSLSRFKAIFDQSPLSIQIVSNAGKTILINSSFKRLWDISDEFAEEFILKEYNILEDPNLEKAGQLDVIKKAFRGESVEVPEFFYDPAAQGHPGRARWASGIVYPLKDPNGEVREVVIIHKDTTNEHVAVEEREKLLLQLQAIVRQMPAGIMVANHEGEILLYNEQMTKVIGDPDKAKEVFHDSITSSLRGEVIRASELTHHHTDGKSSTFTTSSGPIQNSEGKITAGIIISSDITNEKRVESNQAFLANAKSLLISTLDYDQILERVASSAIPYLADGCMVDIVEGKAIKRIVTKHHDPIIQKYMTELQLKFPPHFDSPQPTAKVIRSGNPDLMVFVDQAVILKHTFNEIHADLITKIGIKTHIAIPLIIRGKVIGAINLFNSKDRANFDEKDFLVAQELARYACVAIDNASLYREAKAAIELRDDFISIASHELRTPITSLNLQIEVLNSIVDDMDHKIKEAPLMRKYLANTNNQLQRLSRLVDDMLDISRISTGKLTLNLRNANLALLIKDALGRFEDHLLSLNIQTKFMYEREIIHLCDPERIDQVITNFMTNAIRYGGRNPIHISLEETNNQIIIKFKDHGRGISKIDQERIFKRFEQAHTEDDVNGLGLGLYINQQIIHEHGGSISIESELQQGAVFIVELPK